MKFTELPIYNGVGDIHVNQFRIHFRVPGLKGDPKQQVGTLVKDFTARFPEFFNGAERALKRNVANVVWGGQLFNGKHKTLKFTIDMNANVPTRVQLRQIPHLPKLAEFKRLFDIPDLHSDWVYIVWNDPSKGFAAQTVRGDLTEDKERAAEVKKLLEARFGLLAPFMPLVDDLVNNNHFLAGRRSWVLGLVEKPGAGPGSPPIFFLETAAVERYSHLLFKLAELDPGFMVDMRKTVAAIWSFMLSNYVKTKRFQLEMNPPREWEVSNRGGPGTRAPSQGSSTRRSRSSGRGSFAPTYG